MKFIITSFVLIFNLLIVPNAYAGESVDYYITHQENKLIVNVTVNSKIPNFNKLYIPGKIWGTDYFPLLKNLKITEQDGKKTYRYEILSRDKKI
ncbi:MAG: hypothetical protein EB127_05245 [Alphaproteobacteria bacterium]|nr:hypothetical protein [Alphaproteobacteria bacterium]